MSFNAFIIIATFCIASGSALQCYQCLGNHNTGCLEKPENENNAKLITCEQQIYKYPDFNPITFPLEHHSFSPRGDSRTDAYNPVYGCVKYTFNSTFVYRTCVKGELQVMNDYCNRQENLGDVFCNICTEEKCNSSYIILPSFTLSVFIYFAIKLF